MIGKIKVLIYNWFFYKKRKNKIGLSFSEFNRIRKYPANYIGTQSAFLGRRKIIFTSPFWFLHSIEEIFVDEVYKFLSLKEDPVIIDCGANIGLSVIYFKKLYPAARITAFEADPAVYKILNENLSAYSFSDITLINKAVWNDNTKLEFDAEGTVGGRLGLGEVVIQNKVEVETIRLRDFLNTKVDFLKIDIEGAEYEVLKDCIDRLGNVDRLFLEYHVMPAEIQHLDQMLLWLRIAGFRYYIREAWQNLQYPFVDRKKESYEMQLNIFCFKK